MHISVLVAALVASLAVQASAQTSVRLLENGTVGINGLGSQAITGELTVSNQPSESNFPLKRAFLVFPTDSIPPAFDSCVLQLNETTTQWRGERIDVSIIPTNSYDYTGKFDYVFSETFFFCNPISLQSAGITSVDVSDCVRSALQSHTEFLILRLAVPLYSGEQHFATFSPKREYQAPPRLDPEPQLIFIGAVASQSSNLGSIKSLFR